MGASITSCGGTVIIYWCPVHKGLLDGNSIPDNKSEEPGQGRLEETAEAARIFKK